MITIEVHAANEDVCLGTELLYNEEENRAFFIIDPEGPFYVKVINNEDKKEFIILDGEFMAEDKNGNAYTTENQRLEFEAKLFSPLNEKYNIKVDKNINCNTQDCINLCQTENDTMTTTRHEC